MILILQKILLFSILFSLISQLGKHFWPDFAYVTGIRVDYLSPTLYVSDVLIVALFLISIPLLSKKLFNSIANASKMQIFGALVLTASTILASYPIVAVWGIIKLIEMVFVGYMIANLFSKLDLPVIARVLSVAVVLQCILIFLQMALQSSVGGIWYFIGERSFSASTIGISTVSLYGNELLRAYGSFPHPNVLAFFMLFSALNLAAYVTVIKDNREKLWMCSMMLLSVVSLLLTFSRLTILIFIFALLWLSYKKLIAPKIGIFLLASVFVGIGMMAPRFSLDVFSTSDFTSRLELAGISISIIKEHPLFGVGLLNYFTNQIPYQREITPVLLQPVHNIYLLSVLQVGLLGTIPFIYFIKQTVKRFIKLKKHNPLIMVNGIVFISLLVVGLSDHFFLTLQQGMLMVAFITGLVWLPDGDK